MTADAARSVCGDGIAEEAVGFVASIIHAHQVDCEEEIEKGKKKKKKNKKKKKKKKKKLLKFRTYNNRIQHLLGI